MMGKSGYMGMTSKDSKCKSGRSSLQYFYSPEKDKHFTLGSDHPIPPKTSFKLKHQRKRKVIKRAV